MGTALEQLGQTTVDACTLNNVLNVVQLLVLVVIVRIVRPLSGS